MFLVDSVDNPTFLQVWRYRKSYSSNHVLKRLIGSWKKSLDKKKKLSLFLVDVSKAFDSIPHDLIAKMYAYGFSKNSLELFCT